MTTLSPYDSMSPVTEAAYRAKAAAASLAPLPRADKDDALLAIADALEVRTSEIVEANAKDVAKAREAGISEGMIDRLTLTPERIRAIASDAPVPDAPVPVLDLADIAAIADAALAMALAPASLRRLPEPT